MRCFAVTSAYLFSGSLDKTIRQWDLYRITKVCSERFAKVLCFDLRGHTDSIRSLCCTKDELRLISGSNDMTVRIWDIQTGEAIQILAGLESRICCVCMSEDGKLIICGSEDHTIRTWDLETGCPTRILQGHTDWVTSVSGIPGSDKIVSGSSDMNVILWDVRSSPIILSVSHEYMGDKKCPVLSLCQYNKQLIITCTKDKVCVWDPQQQYQNEFSRAFSDMMGAEISCMCENKTNKSVVICCSYKSRGRSTVIEWFANDADNCIKYRDYRGIINCICSCMNYIIIGFAQKNAVLIKELVYSSVREQTFCLNVNPLTIDCVPVNSSSNSIYIIIGSQNKDILVWKYDCCNLTKCFVLIGHTYSVRCLTHSTISKIDRNYNYIISGSADYNLKLWRLPVQDTCETMVKITAENSFEGHTLSVLSVFCTEELIASGSADCTIIIWSFNDRNPLRTLIGHTNDVTGLQISIARHLVSVSKDGTMKIWDLSVGCNVPSDDELLELIQWKHNEYGYCAQVTDIMKSMTCSVSEKRSLLVDIVNSHQSLSLNDKNAALQEIYKLWEHGKISMISKYYYMGGFLNSFQLRVKKGTMDLIPYSDKGHDGETIPLVHWMSRKPHYRDYLLDKILPTHSELLYSRAADGKTFFSEVVQNLYDLDFTNRSLQILSSNLERRSLEMMWRDHYAIYKTGLEDTYPLIDVEDIVQALRSLWRVDIIRDGILSLQRAPDVLTDRIYEKMSEHNKHLDKSVDDNNSDMSIPTGLQGKKLSFWESYSEDKFLVKGCDSLFSVENVDSECNRQCILGKCFYRLYSVVKGVISLTEDHPDIIQVMYVPFPMRLCRRGKYANKEHTSSLLVQVCIEIAIKSKNLSVFESSTLSAILIYKLRKFGWSAYYVQCLSCITLAVHFGYYALVHSKTDLPICWPILLFIHSIPVVILEFLPLHLSTAISLNSTEPKKFMYCCIFLGLLQGVVCAILWVSYDQPGSECDVILNIILFLIIFFCTLNNLKYMPKLGLFVRVLFQVLGRMWNYILLLIIFVIGFATTFYILIPAVRIAYDHEFGDTSDKFECINMKATAARFQHPVISLVSTYMMMMNAIGWDSTAFNIPSAYSIYALIILVCIFVFISNVTLSITISLMNNIYDTISKNERAKSNLLQAQYILRIERLLLYCGLISHDNPKDFPRWIFVVCRKVDQSNEKNNPKVAENTLTTSASS